MNKEFSERLRKCFSTKEVKDNAKLIVENLRKDNKNYEANLLKTKDSLHYTAQYTNKVWGEFDAPVNKMFDRSPRVPLRLAKDEDLLVIKGKGLSTGKTILYITLDKDEWYSLSGRDADDLLNNCDVLETY